MTGRFRSRDPQDGYSSDPVSLHKYLYANGDPTNRIDPGGNEATVSYTRVLTIAAVATTGVIALRNGINCAYFSNDTRTTSTVYAGPFGQVSFAGSCTWEGSPPSVYPLPFPFPISTPAPWGPFGKPGSCDSNNNEEWHHLVPQAERDWAEGCGFNIDQPGLGMCIKGSCHRQVHGSSNGTDWNAEWKFQIDNVWGRGPNGCPSPQALVQFATSMAVRFADDILCEE